MTSRAGPGRRDMSAPAAAATPKNEISGKSLTKLIWHLAHSTEASQRMKALGSVENAARSGAFITEDHFLKLWQGLYYCMWHSDKPLVQQELMRRLAEDTAMFPDPAQTLLYVHFCFATLQHEWGEIDDLRLDKFLMSVRFFFEEAFAWLQSKEWDARLTEGWADAFQTGVLRYSKELSETGLVTHAIRILFETMAGLEKIPVHAVVSFMRPFLVFSALTGVVTLRESVRRDVIVPALQAGRQTSTFETGSRSYVLSVARPDCLPEASEIAKALARDIEHVMRTLEGASGPGIAWLKRMRRVCASVVNHPAFTRRAPKPRRNESEDVGEGKGKGKEGEDKEGEDKEGEGEGGEEEVIRREDHLNLYWGKKLHRPIAGTPGYAHMRHMQRRRHNRTMQFQKNRMAKYLKRRAKHE
eukprot:TRINITY_DN7331_c0_g1_i1.p1 TRINITY_DN7331_c0_g1~~TRINITY_DN7331_c0_g1_i1.p1  ORF type:complete len:431 (+),score=87.02 TRINITY_DN7331_c0_g1_i1:52-1293(+)